MGKKKKNRMILVLYSGEKVEVLSENGKYYICEGRQFRLRSQQISTVEFVPLEEGNCKKKKEKASDEKSDA